jgi:hypothetical protein
MVRFLTHPYFENSTEEFHPHETLSTPIKFSPSLSLLIWCHISMFNTHKTLMKPHWDGCKHYYDMIIFLRKKDKKWVLQGWKSLSMIANFFVSHEIKCLYRMELSNKSGYFINVSIHSIWHNRKWIFYQRFNLLGAMHVRHARVMEKIINIREIVMLFFLQHLPLFSRISCSSSYVTLLLLN